MNKLLVALLVVPVCLLAPAGGTGQAAAEEPARSCQPRKTCGMIGDCATARWYLEHCPWGGRLDRDKDGVPCESLCGGGTVRKQAPAG